MQSSSHFEILKFKEILKSKTKESLLSQEEIIIRDKIKSKDTSSQSTLSKIISDTPIKFSLLCLLSYPSRILIPVRTKHCKHPEAFDLTESLLTFKFNKG